MSIPEDQLWSLLDDWGLPFRLSCQELMDQYGSEPDRCFEGYHSCRVPCTSPLSSLLAEPWQFYVGPSTIRSQTPGVWIGYIRLYENALANLKMVYDRLRPAFGEPSDTSCSNTKEWVWQFGHAQVSAVVFPPESNSHWGHNPRHDLIPGSKTECSIRISDCWREAMPECHQAKYQTSALIWKGNRNHSWDWIGSGTAMQIPDKLQISYPDLGLLIEPTTNDLYLRAFADVCWWIRKAQVSRLEYVHLLPAKGPGGSWLSAGTEDSLRDLEPMFRGPLIVATNAEHPEAIEASQRLAELLQIPLSVTEDYDC